MPFVRGRSAATPAAARRDEAPAGERSLLRSFRDCPHVHLIHRRDASPTPIRAARAAPIGRDARRGIDMQFERQDGAARFHPCGSNREAAGSFQTGTSFALWPQDCQGSSRELHVASSLLRIGDRRRAGRVVRDAARRACSESESVSLRTFDANQRTECHTIIRRRPPSCEGSRGSFLLRK